jgi:hypothetical protein
VARLENRALVALPGAGSRGLPAKLAMMSGVAPGFERPATPRTHWQIDVREQLELNLSADLPETTNWVEVGYARFMENKQRAIIEANKGLNWGDLNS